MNRMHTKKPARLLSGLFFDCYWFLGNLGDFEHGVVLAVAANGVNAFLGFVADRGHLVSLDIGFNDFSAYGNLINDGSTNRYFVAVDDQKGLEIMRLCVTLEEFYLKRFAFGHHVLLSTGADNCFFHTIR